MRDLCSYCGKDTKVRFVSGNYICDECYKKAAIAAVKKLERKGNEPERDN